MTEVHLTFLSFPNVIDSKTTRYLFLWLYRGTTFLFRKCKFASLYRGSTTSVQSTMNMFLSLHDQGFLNIDKWNLG